MAKKKAKPKRNKSGKVTAWECHLRCHFKKVKKANDSTTYIECCSVKVAKPNLAEVKGTEEMYGAIDAWINAFAARHGERNARSSRPG